jgi:hypothetical protein
MLVRNAHVGKGRLDFRLYRWDASVGAWTIAQRTIPMREVGLGATA